MSSTTTSTSTSTCTSTFTTPPEMVRVGCSCLVLSPAHPGCVLLGRRLGSHGAGKFALPGGHLEFGERFEACLMREVKEETNLDIKVYPSDFVFATNSPNMEGRHYVTAFMIGRVLPKSPELVNVEPNKCEGWSWVKWTEIEDMPEEELFEPLRQLIKTDPNLTGKALMPLLYGC